MSNIPCSFETSAVEESRKRKHGETSSEREVVGESSAAHGRNLQALPFVAVELSSVHNGETSSEREVVGESSAEHENNLTPASSPTPSYPACCWKDGPYGEEAAKALRVERERAQDEEFLDGAKTTLQQAGIDIHGMSQGTMLTEKNAMLMMELQIASLSPSEQTAVRFLQKASDVYLKKICIEKDSDQRRTHKEQDQILKQKDESMSSLRHTLTQKDTKIESQETHITALKESVKRTELNMQNIHTHDRRTLDQSRISMENMSVAASNHIKEAISGDMTVIRQNLEQITNLASSTQNNAALHEEIRVLKQSLEEVKNACSQTLREQSDKLAIAMTQIETSQRLSDLYKAQTAKTKEKLKEEREKAKQSKSNAGAGK